MEEEEVVALTEAEAALWRFLLSIALTDVAKAHNRPIDDPLRWLLAQTRLLSGARAAVLEVGDRLRPERSPSVAPSSEAS